MARFRDFLMRFRLVGSPGPAATGVPADRSAELAAELEPPFSLLEQTEAEVRQIRERAERRAQRRRRAADRLAAHLVAEAHTRSGEVRADSAARALSRSEAEIARFTADAERELALLRHRAEERMPALVDRMAAEVTAGLRGPTAGSSPPPGGPADPRRGTAEGFVPGPQESPRGGPASPHASYEARRPREERSPWAPDG